MAMAHQSASAAEIRAAVGTTVAQRTVTNRLPQGQLRARCPVACITLNPNHCRLRRDWCQARAHWRTEWRYVVFSDESWFCLGASEDRVRSTLVVISRTLTANLYISLVIQPVVLPFINSIQGGVFQHVNARPHTAVVTQHALQSVDMLPWSARSPDLSPMKHVWDIIGRQLQRHP
ncbi:hypothetical protein AVEN_36726-1 [Araneus ventricosus]|uniref:Transposable element Tc1 transposase n=1 Tax=Araneus ventricosus TaxID=182803 RepID=A0A4Y2TIE6_ARAVE|nr:hypothetical protein AVEN_36726-1 [Araneus ventricosus]